MFRSITYYHVSSTWAVETLENDIKVYPVLHIQCSNSHSDLFLSLRAGRRSKSFSSAVVLPVELKQQIKVTI